MGKERLTVVDFAIDLETNWKTWTDWWNRKKKFGIVCQSLFVTDETHFDLEKKIFGIGKKD